VGGTLVQIQLRPLLCKGLRDVGKFELPTLVQKLTNRSLGRLLKGSLKFDLEAIGIGIDTYRSAKANHWKIHQTDKYSQIIPQTPLTPQLLPSKSSSSGIKEYHDSTPLTANSTKTDMPSSVESVESNCPKPSQTPQPEARHSTESGISGISGVKNGYLSDDDDDDDDDWTGNDINNGYLSGQGADGQLSLLPDELVNPESNKIPNHYLLEDGDQDEF